MYNRLRVYIEGADKSGKTTLIKNLRNGLPLTYTDNNGNTLENITVVDKYPSWVEFKETGDQTVFIKDHIANAKVTKGQVILHDRSILTTQINVVMDLKEFTTEDKKIKAVEKGIDTLIQIAQEQKDKVVIIILDSEQLTEDEHITKERREKLRKHYLEIAEDWGKQTKDLKLIKVEDKTPLIVFLEAWEVIARHLQEVDLTKEA